MVTNLNIPQGTLQVFVSFSAEINPNTTESLLAVMAHCANQGVQEVYLLLSTAGGSVMHGLNLHNVLKGMPFKLTTHNVGNVDSIGNVVFLAGTKRYATPHSTFMFHGVGFNTATAQRFEEKNLRERLDGIVSDQQRIGAIITQYCSITDNEVADLFLQGQTRDAQFAVDKGIIHEIRDVQIPTGAPVVSLVFQRQPV